MFDRLTKFGTAAPKGGSTPKTDPLIFIREVAKYFMDFLETDFHKRQTPKRAVRFRNPDNLLVGLGLSKYPSFNASVWKLINRSFATGVLDHTEKGVYRTPIPQNLFELIRLQVEKLSELELHKVTDSVASELSNAAVLYAKEYERALTTTLDAASSFIKVELVLPLIGSIEKPLQNLEIGDENTMYLMEDELTSILTGLLTNKISELLRLAVGKHETNLAQELSSIFELADIKTRITEFFGALQVGDLFLELFEMERNRAILDKEEFYLYFCDITFNRAKYPIFYIPFAVERDGDTFAFDFDAQVYINKRALEYIVQEINAQEQRRGGLKGTAERIIYLAQHQHDFKSIVSALLNELTNVFQLDRAIDINSPAPQVGKSQSVRISNTCYVALFDKSDEALVNDYEEILQLLTAGHDDALASAFNKLIDDFIHREPKSFNQEVENEWDSSSPSEKLVFNSPIPLNSEQRQILAALNKDGCRYITVEGPPGTGKSHTITAVVFDAILKDRSVLVLSDKKEALDVVEEKITDTMNRVRYDRHFQNPILRLGRTGSTYNQILSTASMENIKTHYRAVKNKYDNVEQDIEKLGNSLKEDLEAEILAYGEIDPRSIRELEELHESYQRNECPVAVSELIKQEEAPLLLEDLRNIGNSLQEIFGEKATGETQLREIPRLLGWRPERGDDPAAVQKVLDSAATIKTILEKTEKTIDIDRNSIRGFRSFSEPEIPKLRQFLGRYQQCRSSLFGYLFKGQQLANLDAEFAESFELTTSQYAHKILPTLRSAYNTFSVIAGFKQDLGQAAAAEVDVVAVLHRLLVRDELRSSLDAFANLQSDYLYLRKVVFPNCPRTLEKAQINPSSFQSILRNKLTELANEDFDRLVRYVDLEQKFRKTFDSIPNLAYTDQQAGIEDLVTIQMTYLLDGRVIEFYEHSRNTARALRDIIRSKQRFPKDEFSKLKKAFPCILAGIRDYAEYIPLEPEIFDLLIIDEASQVSIAQAFPALLRAKKILILGDKKQFSNVKAAQARSDTNREYLNNLEEVFRTHVAQSVTKLKRLERFNIRTSILEFFEFITNYHTQLLKYFRGYKEIISYSNKYFYRDSLQVMKIRGKPIDDVLKFTIVKDNGKVDLVPNTNKREVEAIIGELWKLKESKARVSVGIITPHTNQQKVLMESISRLPERDYFFDEFKLKIMTFDTCQGEERDVIFYSMVATKYNDRLWGVFIKDLNNVDVEEEGKIKAQRLNVGFSRAKECMHFILSKQLTDFSGSIGEALRHYQNALNEARKERSVVEVDPRSMMEPVVLNWFYQTPFWRENKDRIELIPKFEIGRYLKQLDKTYSHPLYRGDFLLVYRDDATHDRKFILEYDGFREHFQDLPGINATNYEEYYSEEHVYRQKVLESYGYKFLRINRFNVGANPIATLDQRLHELVKNSKGQTAALESIHKAIEGLQDGNLKECPKCKTLRVIEDFRDPALVSGYGRFCRQCKGRSRISKPPQKGTQKPAVEYGPKPCPRCGSQMILRKGRYGKFYGCSRFPYCRAIRQFVA